MLKKASPRIMTKLVFIMQCINYKLSDLKQHAFTQLKHTCIYTYVYTVSVGQEQLSWVHFIRSQRLQSRSSSRAGFSFGGLTKERSTTPTV